MDRGAWRTTVHGIAKSQTPPRDSLLHTHTLMVMILVTGDDDSSTERAYTAGGDSGALGDGDRRQGCRDSLRCGPARGTRCGCLWDGHL